MLTVKTTRALYDSPLRYPGGKSSLTAFLAEALKVADLPQSTYVEPFAGGAGAGISLLIQDRVERIVINDLDPAVFSFWSSLTENGDDFIERVEHIPLTLDEWRAQRSIYATPSRYSTMELGLAFFYLNRTNRSGVLNAGVIGGQKQDGRYKLDARFNRDELIRRLQRIHALRDRISVSSEDGRALVERYSNTPRTFLYIDPPYVQAGGSLYLNAFSETDHALLATCLNRHSKAHWVLTYDDDPLIRELYEARYSTTFELNYSARDVLRATERMVLSDAMREAYQI